jgi:transposase
VNRRFEITGKEWDRLAPLLPAMTPGRGGRWRDHRQVLNGILFRVRSGVPWRDLPERYGPWETVYKRFARWQTEGTWARIEAALRTQVDAAEELDWNAQIDSSVVRAHQHAAGARKGAPVDPGKPAASAGAVTGRVDHQAAHRLRWAGPQPSDPADPGPGRRHPSVGRAGGRRAGGPLGWARPAPPAARSSDRRQGLLQPGQPAALRARRIPQTIPEREDQKANRARRGARGGRPPAFDRDRYRTRNQVERLMNRRKQFRAVATRFDKLAVRYQATVWVADIFIWLRARPDRSRSNPRNRP